MSCNCKGNKYIVETRKVFGEREPRKRDIPLKEKSIVILKSIMIWCMITVFLPITLPILLLTNKKKPGTFNHIKIRF